MRNMRLPLATVVTLLTLETTGFAQDDDGLTPCDDHGVPKQLVTPAQKKACDQWRKQQQALDDKTKKVDQAQDKVSQAQDKVDKAQDRLEKSREGAVKMGTERKDRPPEKAAPAVRLPFGLPSWDTPKMDLNLEPIFGQQFKQKTLPSSFSSTLDFELGAQADAENVPLWSDFGLYASAMAGGARGSHSTLALADVTKIGKEAPTSQSTFNTRQYWGAELTVILDSIQQKIGFEKGSIAYKETPLRQLDSFAKKYGLGVQVPGHLSLWYSLRDFRAFEGNPDDPTVAEIDHFLHAQAKYEPLHLDFDLGLGFSKTDIYQFSDSGRSVLGAGLSKSFRADLKFKLTEHFVFDSYAKYAYSASSGLESAYEKIRMPTDRLNSKPAVMGAPEDTLTVRAFAGLVELVENLTAGYAYNLDIVNATSDKEKKTEKTNGPILEYHYSF